ncbi:FAD-dependent monooxygenase [Streptomyces sp. 6N223]|uniref:FAD-dependent monooxygenase n=1 Tax=Streptomyces sp. 6N223 TaxID=3457412 RepID=UPI003FD4C132
MSDPIIIAGGGPVGLLLSLELGRAGVPSVVLEKRPGHHEDERVGTFHSRLVEIFRERGLMEALGETPPWPAVHFGMVWLDLSKLESEYNLLVSQTKIEQLLESRAAELGADIRRGHTVTGFEQDEAGVTVRVTGGEAGAYELRGAYLVGCDGVDSTVRELAGIGVTRSGKSWYGVMGDFESYDGEFDAGVRPGGVFGALPEGTGRWRLQTLEFDIDGPPESEPVTVEELVSNIKRLTGETKVVGEPLWMRRYSGTTQLAERYQEGRVFLAGEAAHYYVPTASHGLNTGLSDAVNLGWKLAAAVRGRAPEGLLESYHAERHPAGYRACQAAQAQMALIHPLEKVAALREVFQELVGIEEVNRRLVTWSTDIRYELGDGEPAGSLVGRRVPHVPLRTAAGESGTGELLGGGRGVLLVLDEEFAVPSGSESRVDVVRAEPVAELEASALLLRPDGYIAWAGSGAEAEGLKSALDAWFGGASGS